MLECAYALPRQSHGWRIGHRHSGEGSHMFGRGRGGFGGGFSGPRERFFERGDLKYVILELVAEKPRHGYDIIRALEERSRGFYKPSPGTVYPTLQMLEEMDYVSGQEQDGKRTYTITEAGRRFLAERGERVDDARGRIGGGWSPEFKAEVQAFIQEVQEIGRLFRHQWLRTLQPAQLRRIRDVIGRARREIEEIVTEPYPGEHRSAAAQSDGQPAGEHPSRERPASERRAEEHPSTESHATEPRATREEPRGPVTL
ncbi:MAG: helix-turn-helix transcriptional regulator [Chloroflexi bacterium]|nr:helix-turn-helix transcriptional regulator [Chloroflexota bacterium]